MFHPMLVQMHREHRNIARVVCGLQAVDDQELNDKFVDLGCVIGNEMIIRLE